MKRTEPLITVGVVARFVLASALSSSPSELLSTRSRTTNGRCEPVHIFVDLEYWKLSLCPCPGQALRQVDLLRSYVIA